MTGRTQTWLMRFAATIVAVVGNGALADPDLTSADEGQHPATVSAPPMLERGPFPSGYKPPVSQHIPQSVFIRIPKSADLDNLRAPCLAFDIGLDGRVTNIVLYRSSGISVVDQFAVASAADSRYEPATINGKPIAERIISQRQYDFGQHHNPEAGLSCSWDMYDAYMAQHTHGPGHGQSTTVP